MNVRGRPAKANEESTEAVNRESEKGRARNKRRHFGAPQSRLSIFKDIEESGFHPRWINDSPGRLHQAQESGYTFVEPAEVGREAGDENKVKELAGVQRDGVTPMFAYLMKIPMEWYLEDREALDESTSKIDDAIRNGRLEKTAGDGRYVPNGGITYKT